MPIEKSAGAVVFRREENGKIKYLLLKHSEKYWNFPKGKIDGNEKEIETAQREIKEETGIREMKIIPGFKVWEKYFYRASKNRQKANQEGKTIFKLVIFYLIETKEKEVRISFEHQGYEWLAFNEAMERLKRYKGSQKILTKANDFLLGRGGK